MLSPRFSFGCCIFGLNLLLHGNTVESRLMELTIKRPLLRLAQSACALLCGALVQAPAWADIYLCVDAQGRREMTDVKKPGCKPLIVTGAIPAPPSRSGAVRSGGSNAVNLPTPTPSNFPRVDNAQQKARDSDRREILNEELRNEELHLATLRRDFNNGEPERRPDERNVGKYQARVTDLSSSIKRSEANIKALRREIDNIR
jgi:hypothetical protein